MFFHDVFSKHSRMIVRTLLSTANWDQLERIWAFIVGFFKFLWALLKLLGGG